MRNIQPQDAGAISTTAIDRAIEERERQHQTLEATVSDARNRVR